MQQSCFILSTLKLINYKLFFREYKSEGNSPYSVLELAAQHLDRVSSFPSGFREYRNMNSSSGNSAPAIGEISAASGKVIAIKPDGTQIVLEPGDKVFLNDRVVSENGDLVVITTSNNQVLELSGQQPLTLTDSVLSGQDTDIDEEQAEEELADEEVRDAVAEGADPGSPTEASAAKEDTSEERSPDQTEPRLAPSDIPVITLETDDQLDEESITESSEILTASSRPVTNEVVQQQESEKESETPEPVVISYQPVAQALSMDGNEDSPILQGQLSATDNSGGAGGALTYSLVSATEAGSINISGDGSFEFKPGADFDYLAKGESQTVTFVFEVINSQGNRSQASVGITIEGVNDTPEVEAPIVLDLNQNDSGISLDLLQKASDKDLDDELSVTSLRLVSGNEAGVSVTEEGSELVIDPEAYKYLAVGEMEIITYEYQVSDSQGDFTTQTASITLAGSNDDPVVQNAILLRTNQNSPSKSIDLLAGSTDVDQTDTLDVVNLRLTAGDPVGISISEDGNSLSLDSSAYNYLAAGESERIDYSYEVDDGHGGTVSQSASITIEGLNDAPTISNATDVAGAVTEIVDGGAGENSNSLTDTGSFTIADVDLSDQQTVSVSAGANGYLGSLTATVADDTQGDGSGRIDWSFSVDDADIDYLGAGQTLTQTYTVTVDDGEGGTVDQQVTITLTGTNDAPTITSATDVAGAVTEIVDGGAGENSNSLTDTGSFTIADVDLSDQQTVSVSAGANGYLGSLTASVADDTQGDGSGRIDWSFSVDDADIDYLGAGQTLTQTYTVTVDDGEGGTVDQQVTITLTGTNDAPTITSATDVAGAVTEIVDGGAGENSNSLTDTGSFTIADVDLSDQQTVSVSAGANGYLGSLTASVADDTQGDGSGRIDWSFSVDDADIDYLGAGQTLTQTYTVTVDDGEGGTVDQQVTITLTGTNDAPTITSATDVAGAVTEIVDGGAGENSNSLTDTGSFTIADVDLSDQQTVSVSAGANGYLGSLTASVADDTQGDGSGRIDWSFSVDDADIDYLGAGQTLTQTYTVTVDDGEGGTVDQQVTITLTGTNDAPTITSATDVAGAVTEIVDGGAGENSNSLTDTGSFTIADVDLSDQQTVSVSAGANGYLGSLTATVADDTQGDGSGRIDWSFSVDDADVDYLGVGQTLTQTYTVTVDDGEGGTVDQQVTITLTGTNDAPTISSATDVSGTVTEIVDGGAGENSNTLTDSGSFTIADVDLSDQQSVSVSAGANGYLGSLTATVADDTQGDGSGRIDWSFSVDDADVDYLGVGQTLTQTYTVTVDDGEGGTVDQQVTITLTGTNDAPTISSATDVSGTVTEIFDGGAGENSNTLTDSGSFTIADVDLSDQQSVSVRAGANGYLGSLTATVADDTQGDGSGRIDWSFSVDDADVDYLGAGQTLTQTYTVTVDDGEGGTVDQQVTITLTGTNDTAVITGADTGSVTEDAGNTLMTSGILSVTDVDGGEASFTPETVTGSYGSLTIDGSGSWSYSADNSLSAIQTLGDGDTLTETVTVKSLDGTTHDIVITINGTNDTAVITGADTGSVTEDAGNTLMTSGSLTVTDVDGGEASFTAETVTGSYGSLTIDGSGSWSYSASNSNADIQALGDGGTLTETVTVKSLDGTTHDIVITINGTNDTAVITGADTGSVTEDAGNTLMTSGILSVTDVDGGEASFTPETVTGSYGSLTIDGSGSWSYSADNSLSAIQTLGDGDTLTETVTVKSLDGTTHDIVITINGTNDTAVITGADTGSVTEDAGNTLMTSGSLTVTDVDGGEASFTAETVTGSYGSLTIDGSGSWSYSASNSNADIQALGDGGTLTETVTVKSLDGTTHDIVITINGTNDTAVITGADTGSVTEDAGNTLMTSGSLTVTDVDGGEASFTPETITGSYGSLTIDGSGSWSYSADNSLSAIQSLGDGDTLTETVTVKSLDGTTQDIVITINGTNDAAVITGADTGSVTEDAGNTLMTSGSLTVTDVDGGEASFTAETITGSYGSLTIDGSGSWSYSADNSLSAIQSLGDGDTLTETVTVKSLDGTTHDIVITINGTNDAAVITGADTGSVTEDAGNTLMTSGSLTVTDVDGGEASFTAETITGSYGSLTIDGSGSWSYSADNSLSAIQTLGDGDTLTETVTVKSLDGTTHDIVITINGTNDTAVITGADTGSVTEDAGNTLMTSGSLTVTDVDGGEASFTAETVTGSYGSLTIDGSGSWSYSASNSNADIQALGDGGTLTETVTVKSLDGTTQDIVITINGTNDAAVITGADTGSVTEDAGNTLMTSGSLTVTDVDGGEASFTPETVTGSYGSLTIDGSGSWSYSADNSLSAIQSLGDGDTLTETVTVKSLDGTTQDIVITINGTNDAAVITGADTGSVTEDAGNTLMTSGSLTVTDVDGGEASFTAETITGSYGSLTIDGSGSWSYSADNSLSAIQTLGDGDTLTETVTVKSLDGTTHDIVITINGTNDTAVITGADTGSVTEDAGNTLMTSGSLTVTDVDGGEASFTAETITGSYGSLTIDGSGSWSYSADNSLSAIQSLGDGDTLTETVTVKSLDGTTHDIVITINGTNDAAVITGADTGSVTEDAGNTLMTSGILSVTDVDGGEASFTPETVTGSYGSLTIDGSGSWSYSADNSLSAIQSLGDGDTLTETVTVKSLDGTTHDIVITINGTNDAAVITGADTGSVTEDAGNTLMTSGSLSVTDVDGGEASFTPETVTGSYGSLTIDGSGSWSYSASNSHADIQALEVGDTLTETLTVKSLDGTTHDIVITINGANDAAVITGDDTGSVTEDASNTLMASGSLTVTDVDSGEASFTPETVTGSYGSLTMASDGSWSYSASNSQADIQALGDGDTLTDTVTVKSLDGTTHNIVITINGTNDAAVITGADTGSVTEDSSNTLMTSGSLTVTDVDGGEASFTPETVTGSYGSLTMASDGSWSYSASNSQALGDGDTLTDTVTVKSLDGTTHDIVITINGTNDAAVITGADTGSVTEDASNTLMASGSLTVTDVDSGEASFTPETVTGSYGSLTMASDGSWSYSASNSQADIQALGDGDTLTDTVTVKSLDGTTHDIVITINGTNDAAVITGADTGSVTEDASNTLMASGSLTVTDVDSGEASFTPETVTGSYGSLTMASDGSWSYSASNSQADIQALGDGDTLTDTVTVKSLDGTTHNIVITINGTNDAAVITGADTGSVTEDSSNTLMTSGSLTVTDVDGGEASFTPETVTGSYGSLTIDGSGSWSYSASNSNADIQALGDGGTLTETVTVKSLDGTTHDIVITINGTNDTAVITGADTGSVTEDAGNTLMTSGILSVTDVDGGEASFTPETVTGSYGSLTIDGSGSWSYSADNSLSAIQTLGDGDTLTETVTVKSLDGTTHDIVITINGTNDTAVITGADTGNVTEDAGNTLMTSGSLTVTDVDGGEASFTAETVTGSYGSLTIDGSGSWSYSADNSLSAIQTLGDGDTLTETVTVKSLDGTTQDIVITINGTNDAAVITGADTGSVTEDAGNTLMTSGSLTVTDVDGGEASFTAETITGSYGSLTIDGSGSWSYSADNSLSAIQSLGDGDTLTETVTVKSQDGTNHDIVITINGTNDAAVITGADTGSVTEDAGNTLMTSGSLAVTDVDGGEASFTAETVTGSYGSLTMASDGSWSYSASNSHADIQALGDGDTLTETLTVKSLDGTTHNIVITINGTNDAAVITGADTGSVTEDAGNTLMTSGSLTVTDVDGGEASFTAETVTGSYGSLTMASDGSWSYSASNSHADIQALGDGDTLTETITVQSLDGTTHNIVITINGTNDAAVITGADTGSVTEDAGNTLTTSGSLTVTDVDGGEASFTAETVTGSYGSLTMASDGSWSYSASNSHADIQALGDGDTLTETITVQSLDGTTHNIVITINGTNDAAVITGADTGSVTEDAGNTLTTSGSLTVTDVDGGEASFTAETVTGSYGSLTMASDGSWSYSASNSHADIQALGDGDTLTETITVQSLDGTTHNIVITINGTNDAAVITGADTGSVTEDAGNTLMTSGSLAVTDVDGGEASFTAETVTGSYGSLTMASDGSWSYSASNSQADIQALGDGDTLTETLTVKSLDGTTHNIVITINGTNDAAVITGADTGSVTEDAGNTLTTSGSLTVTDVDGGEASFTPETVTGSYGSLTMASDGSWSYSASNSQADIQALGDGDTLTETVTVKSLDGTTHDIVITINGTNDAPTAADNNLSLSEAGQHTFTNAEFGFSDVDSGDSLASIALTSLPTTGSLTLNGSAVSVNQVISAGDIPNLVFTADASINGSHHGSIGFKVSDGALESSAHTIDFYTPPKIDSVMLDGSFQPVITGTGQPDAVLNFTINGNNYSASVGSDGNWSFTPSLTLNDGDPLNISVTSTEAGGIASSATTYSANVSRGDAQDNTVTGGNNTDFMYGDAGADVLTGGEGDDWLTGGSGQDRFVWQAGDGGSAGDPAIDRITDFSVGAGGDILDLHSLLSGEENTTADQFIHFRTEGSDTIIDVSVVAGGDVIQQIVLENTDLSPLGNTDQEIIEQLLSDGQLTLARTIAIDNNIMGDNQISAAEEGAVLVSGVGEPGASIQVEIEDTSAATVSATVTVRLDGTWSLAGSELDVSALSDGQLDITVTQTDSAGNVTTDNSTVMFSGTAPTLSSAEIVANTQNLVLTFSENMDRDSTPDLADFDVAIDGSAVNVLNISYLNDTQIRLSLDTAVSPSGNLTLDYTPGSNVLQEQVGINPFAALSGFSATVTPDVSAAVRQNMTVEGDQLIVEYNEALDPGSVPDNSAFTLSLVGGGSRTVSNVSISGSRMTLTLDSPVGDSDIVQLSYSVVDASNNGGGPIQDAQGNDSSDFTSALVENNTDTSVPTLNNAVVDGDTLILTYSEDLNESVSLTGILDVEVAGASRSISSASISGNQVTVQLTSPVADGESVTFSYSPSSADSSSNNDRVEDLRGFDAAALNHGDVTVTNITDTISPSLSTAEVDGNTVTLTFSEALNGNATINPSLFSIVVDGQSESVSSLAINGQQLTLTLSKAITDGQSVTLDYTPPAAGSALDNDRLEDLVGNDTSSISSFSVDNVTNSGGNPEVVRLYSDDADQWYRDGDTITVKVEFSEPVQVTGNPTLQLETGTIDRLATYSGGTGTNVLLFTYTVANPDESADLNALSTSALDLGGGTIADLLGNNADLLLPELNEAGALAQQNDIRIDTVSPTVGLSSSSASSAGILTLSGDGFSSLLSPGESTDTDLTGRLDWSKLSWRVVDNSGSNTDISFSAADIESALAVNDQQLNIKISSNKLASMRATSGYGNEEGQDLIRITSDGFFQDAAGNTMNDGNSAGVEIFILPPDGIAPSISGVTSLTADGEYATGSVIRLQVSFDEAVEVTGTPVLLLGTGDNISAARFSSGSGTQELVFEYTVQPGDEAPDLDVLSASALQLNGGTIKDLSGNAAVLTVPVAANSDSLASTADILIDGSAPDVSITGVTLAPEGANDQKLTINGSGFDALLGSGESVGLSLTGDELSRFDWSKLSIKLKQPDGSFESVSLDASDIGSVEIHNNRLEIVIDEGVNKVLDNNGFSTVSGDTALDISQGFMADRAGNRSTTDALADQAVTVTSNGATVLNVSSDTVDGSYQAGDEILIRVRFSEKVSLQNYDANNDPLLLLLNDRQPTQADPYGGNAVYVSGDGTREFVFRHTVSAGENIDDLNYRDTSSLTFSNGVSGSSAVSSLVNGAGSSVSLTLPGTASTESLAGSSDIVIDTDAATTTITSAAYDENNNQLLLKGADFDQLLNNSESATADLSGRLDWSKLVIDIDKDDGITQNISFSANDVTVARLAGTDTLSIQLTDAKAAELEGIFGYKGSEDGVDIQAGFLRDLAGNEGAAAVSDLTLDYADIAAPTVVQVSFEDPGRFINGDEVVILIQLSESVSITGIDASDASTYPTLTLDNGAVATFDSGAGTDTLRFVYTVGSGNSENTLGLNYASDTALTIPAGVMVFDSAGNNMLTTLPSVNSNDALAQTGNAIIDVNAPEITSVDSLTSDGPYNEGKVVQIEVSFTEAVDITGIPALNLDTGGQATYSSGAGTDKLVFNYTVGSGEDSSDLDVSSLDLSNGSITDLAGNSVDVSSLPTGADVNSLASNAALEIDTTDPSLPGLGAVNIWAGNSGHPGAIFIYSDGFNTLNSNEVSQMTPDWSKLYVENKDTGDRHYFKDGDFATDSFSRHNSIQYEMNIELTQEGGESFKENFRGYTDWPDKLVVHVEEGFLVDRAGNDYAFSSPQNGLDMEVLHHLDSGGKSSIQNNEITDIRVVSNNDTYKAGEELLIQVDFNHVVKLNYSTTPELRFDIGGVQRSAVLDTSAHPTSEYNNSFLFRYTIQSGDNVSGSISLAASNPIDTVFKEPDSYGWSSGEVSVNSDRNITLTPPSGAGSLDNNSSDLIIDTTAPLTTIASASYDPDTNQLELSGSNFNDILSGNTAADSAELRLVLDWSKISYKVDGSLTESFTEDDVLSAKVLDNNKLVIELAAAKADSIETNSGGDYSDDTLDVSAGFIKDLAGNESTTDALSAGSVTQADLKAPDLTSSLASSNELVLGFSEAISGSPSNSDFTVQIDGSARLVTGVAISGQEVTVTFDGAQIDGSEQLLFSYTGSSLSDSSGNDVVTISDRVAGFDHSSSAGLDTLIGDIGDDIFTIDHDDVTASGGLGADIFDFNATGTAQNPAELIITDFNTDEGDVLKLDDILVDPSDSLDEHFHFVASGNDTVMEISDTANGDVTKKVTFKEVDLFALGGSDADILNNLMDNNNLDHGTSP